MLEKTAAEILGIGDPEIQDHLKKNPDQAEKLGKTLIEMDQEKAERQKSIEEMTAISSPTNSLRVGRKKVYFHHLIRSRVFIAVVIIIILLAIIRGIVRVLYY